MIGPAIDRVLDTDIAAAENRMTGMPTKFQMHLLTPLLHRLYVQAMSSNFLPARTHFAPVNAGVALRSADTVSTDMSSSTITITTTTGTGTGWESVRE
jgi:hypothetical protein